MIGPDDLLDFAAFDLASIDTEAAARRAVSACYYAAFHAIAYAGAELFSGSKELRQEIARSYDHGSVRAMADQMKALAQRRGDDPDLAAIAQNLIQLREMRERADYDLLADITWKEGSDSIVLAFELVQSLARRRSDPGLAELLLLPLLRNRSRRG